MSSLEPGTSQAAGRRLKGVDMPKKALDPISKVDSELGTYEAKLRGELSEFAQKQRNVMAELKRVQAMRKAGEKAESTEPKLPAPKKAEVLEIAVEILKAGPLSVDKLKAAVEKRLRKTHNLSGFSLRMGEALRSDFLSTNAAGLVSPAKAGGENAPRSKAR